jgi:hypothetical protein
MNTKIVLLAAIAVLIVLALLVFSYNPKKQDSAAIPSTSVDSAQLSAAIEDQYSSMISEQLNAMSVDQSTAQMQDSMANDMSKFYA